MKFPTFEEATNGRPWDEARYQIDWQRGERKYKEPTRGILIYECGIVEIIGSGYRDPDWRKEVRARYGLNFRLKKELVGVKFTDPETGARVPRAYLHGDIFLVDDERQRIYSNGCYGKTITLLSPEAQLIPEESIDVRVPDPAAEEAARKRLQKYFDLGRTLLAMEPEDSYRYRYPWMSVGTNQYLRSGKYPTNLAGAKAQEFCREIAYNEAPILSSLRFETSKVYQRRYINYHT